MVDIVLVQAVVKGRSKAVVKVDAILGLSNVCNGEL